eukprot:Gb_29477 [translate_table: standard]
MLQRVEGQQRGKDVEDIYYLLQFHAVHAFLDIKELRTGEEFPDAMMEAIQSSSVRIAIFSPHYAESYWCLRELAIMLKTPNATIIPVFYNVPPGEVRWGKGAFAEAFDKHYRRHHEWRAAPQEISGLSPSDLKGRLQRAVVQEIEDIKGEVEKKGLQEVQRKILHSLLPYDYQVSNLSQGQQIMRKRLNSIDALIVLDNIEEDKKQLDAISSPKFFCLAKLFCRHAFDSSVAYAPFENLVDKFVGICKGVPLALEVCCGEVYGESYAT